MMRGQYRAILAVILAHSAVNPRGGADALGLYGNKPKDFRLQACLFSDLLGAGGASCGATPASFSHSPHDGVPDSCRPWFYLNLEYIMLILTGESVASVPFTNLVLDSDIS